MALLRIGYSPPLDTPLKYGRGEKFVCCLDGYFFVSCTIIKQREKLIQALSLLLSNHLVRKRRLVLSSDNKAKLATIHIFIVDYKLKSIKDVNNRNFLRP